METESSQSPSELKAEPSSAPFSILDLILFTVGFALILAYYSSANQNPESRLGIMSAMFLASYGASVGFGLMLARRCWTDLSLLRQPGCFLGIAYSIEALARSMFVNFIFHDDTSGWDARIMYGVPNFACLVTSAIIVRPHRWKIFSVCYFLPEFITHLSWIASSLATPTRTWLSVIDYLRLLIPVWFIALVVLDRLQKQPRDRWNTFGLVLVALHSILLPVLMAILSRFFTIQQLYGD